MCNEACDSSKFPPKVGYLNKGEDIPQSQEVAKRAALNEPLE